MAAMQNAVQSLVQPAVQSFVQCRNEKGSDAEIRSETVLQKRLQKPNDADAETNAEICKQKNGTVADTFADA